MLFKDSLPSVCLILKESDTRDQLLSLVLDVCVHVSVCLRVVGIDLYVVFQIHQ